MDPLGAEVWGCALGLGDGLGIKGFLSGAVGGQVVTESSWVQGSLSVSFLGREGARIGKESHGGRGLVPGSPLEPCLSRVSLALSPA